VDLAGIRDGIRRRYAAVAATPEGQFPYPVGRKSAESLGYRGDFLERVAPEALRSFVGVGNPFSLGEPESGWRVVDIGCGAGMDSQIAALYVGVAGHVIGVDLSPEMLALARENSPVGQASNVEFIEGQAEDLPIESGWADLVISNGVLNLSACKERAYGEIARVLRPGGRFQAADLVLVKDLPERLRNDQFAWSS
jgi:arsenite methyltransferase